MASASVCRSHVLHVQPHIPLYSTNGGARDFSVAKSFRTRALSSCPSSIPLICKRTKKIFKEEAHSWRNDGNPRRFAGKQGQLERPPLHWQQHSRSKWAPFRCNAAHVEVAANTGLDKQGEVYTPLLRSAWQYASRVHFKVHTVSLAKSKMIAFLKVQLVVRHSSMS